MHFGVISSHFCIEISRDTNIFILPSVFDVAASSGGETWCRAEAAQNLSALRGEVAAVDRQACGERANYDPFPQEETAQSPGRAESEVEESERWEGSEHHEK